MQFTFIYVQEITIKIHVSLFPPFIILSSSSSLDWHHCFLCCLTNVCLSVRYKRFVLRFFWTFSCPLNSWSCVLTHIGMSLLTSKNLLSPPKRLNKRKCLWSEGSVLDLRSHKPESGLRNQQLLSLKCPKRSMKQQRLNLPRSPEVQEPVCSVPSGWVLCSTKNSPACSRCHCSWLVATGPSRMTS